MIYAFYGFQLHRMCYNGSSSSTDGGSIVRFAIVALLICSPLFAHADVSLEAVCDGSGQVRVTVTARNDAMPASWKGLVVERTRIGACGETQILTADLLDLPAPGETLIHVLETAVPIAGVNYRFETRVVDDSGLEHTLPGAVYDHAALGPAPTFVGRVASLAAGHYELQGCEADCWPVCSDITAVQLGVSEVQMLVWATHNTTIAVYAAPAGPLTSGACYENVSEVKVSPSCAPTSTSAATWSSLKLSYR